MPGNWGYPVIEELDASHIVLGKFDRVQTSSKRGVLVQLYSIIVASLIIIIIIIIIIIVIFIIVIVFVIVIVIFITTTVNTLTVQGAGRGGAMGDSIA
eukprot:7527942-Heterocapsa_arctica.AAC.1